MPNRIIKESIRTSKKVNALSDFQFRLWLYLITYVDDYGRGSADPELLKGLVFPRRKGITEEQISAALNDLANTGMVTLYEADEEPYFYFPNWSDHQRIQTKHSKFPDPPSSTVSHRESPPESNPIQSNENPIQSESESESNTNTRETADDALAKVMTYYMENISMTTPSPVVTAEIQDFMTALEPDVVLHALKIAAEADKHDWRYVKGILNRYKTSGLDTLEKVLLEEKRFQAGKNKTGTADEYTGDITAGWDLIYGKGAENG